MSGRCAKNARRNFAAARAFSTKNWFRRGLSLVFSVSLHGLMNFNIICMVISQAGDRTPPSATSAINALNSRYLLKKKKKKKKEKSTFSGESVWIGCKRSVFGRYIPSSLQMCIAFPSARQNELGQLWNSNSYFRKVIDVICVDHAENILKFHRDYEASSKVLV